MKRTILFVLMAGIILIGCTGKEEVQSSTVTLTEDGMIDFSGKTLNVLFSAATFPESVEDFVHEFEEKYNVTVNYDLLGRSSFDEKIIIELSTGSDAHDVYYTFGESLLQYQKSGWLEPLDAYMQNEQLVDAEQLGMDGFAEGPINACTVNGELYGLPVFAATCILYYRTDYFEQAGIDEPPKTWDELIVASEKLQAIGVEPIGMRGNKAFGGSIWHLPMLTNSYGGTFFKDFPNDMTPTVNESGFVQGVEFYANLLNNYGIEGATTANYEDIILSVQQGTVGMWIDGSPLVAQYVDPAASKSAGKVGFSVIPAGPNGIQAAETTHMIVMNKNANEKELAYKFIEWCASKETQVKAAVEGIHVGAARPDVMGDDRYIAKNNYGNGQWAQAASDCLDNAADNYYPLIPEWPEVADVVSSALSEVFTGKDAQLAMDEANDRIDTIMKQNGYY